MPNYRGPSADKGKREKTFSQTPGAAIRKSGDQLTVGDILADKGPDVTAIAPGATVREAVDMLSGQHIGVVVVCDDAGVRGILSERDVVRALGEAGPEMLDGIVTNLMTPDPVCCAPTDILLEVMRLMTEGRFRHMPVTVENKLVGLISIRDVVRYRLKELEYDALRMKQMIVG